MPSQREVNENVSNDDSSQEKSLVPSDTNVARRTTLREVDYNSSSEDDVKEFYSRSKIFHHDYFFFIMIIFSISFDFPFHHHMLNYNQLIYFIIYN